MMESYTNESNEYEAVCQRYQGLFTINSKMQVKDRAALSLVYSPGVGANCKLIEKDLKRAYDLTNKKNSIIIVTDASSLNQYNNIGYNSSLGYPFIEAICVYYKTVANIDAYPIIIDINQIESSIQFQETVNAVMQAYSAVEFFGVSQDRINNFSTNIQLHRQGLGQYAFIGGDYRSRIEIDNKIKKFNITSNLVYSAIIRAALDMQYYTSLNDCVEYIVNDLLVNNTKSQDPYFILTDMVVKSAEFFKNKTKDDVHTPQGYTYTTQQIKNKFLKFLIEGKNSWIEIYPNNYFSHNKSINENSILLHRRYHGVIETGSKITIKDIKLLDQLVSWESLEKVSKLISEDSDNIYKYTCRGNLGAIITNGTAILGFGDIGALAGLPVMEGKCLLFKLFGGINIMPICIQEKIPDKLITIIKRISLSFSAINLEDIKAPECFKVESKLIKSIPYPVFHDDQHGTAIVVLAGIINALKLTIKNLSDVKIVVNGAGAAGLSIIELLITYGATAKNIIICDTSGAIYEGRLENMNEFKSKLAFLTNSHKYQGSLKRVIQGTDIFIGVSAPKMLTKEMIKTMNKDPIIFALANPDPEILPDQAKEAGASVVATGRSDFRNQVNNSLAFPGIFRAVVDTRATKISIPMKIAASKAIADLITKDQLSSDFIIPDSLDSRVSIAVADAVAKEAINSGLSKLNENDLDCLYDNFQGWSLEENLRNWELIKKTNSTFIDNQLRGSAKF